MKCLFRFYLFTLFGFSLMACRDMKLYAKIQNNAVLEGMVTEQWGNAMPIKGKSSSNGQASSAKLYIYKALHLAQLENQNGNICAKINGDLIQTATADSLGHYQFQLPAGSYSLVVAYEKGFFIPYFSGNDGVALLSLQSKKTTILNIKLNQKASY
jgi:hypothetical protein